MRTNLALCLFMLASIAMPGGADAQTLCHDQCFEVYDQCSLSCLNSGANVPGCEEACLNSFDTCSASCPSCPRTRDYQTKTLLNAQGPMQTNVCFFSDQNHTTPKRFNSFGLTLRVRTYRETTHCNGSVTTALLSSTISLESCWQLVPESSCSASSAGSFNSSEPRCPF